VIHAPDGARVRALALVPVPEESPYSGFLKVEPAD
jgi:hypothetical protein